MTFGATFGRMISPTFQPSSLASGGAWWLAGGIAAANCVAAYQPKGAATLAASRINLANPGTYNVTNVTTDPTWSADNGWSGSVYLNTGIGSVYQGTWSIIVRCYLASNDNVFIAGRYPPNSCLCFTGMPSYKTTRAYWGSGSKFGINNFSANSVHCLASNDFYTNGTLIGNTGGTFTPHSNTLYALGARDAGHFTGNIYALAIYNVTLSSTQVTALTTAMNAL